MMTYVEMINGLQDEHLNQNLKLWNHYILLLKCTFHEINHIENRDTTEVHYYSKLIYYTKYFLQTEHVHHISETCDRAFCLVGFILFWY